MAGIEKTVYAIPGASYTSTVAYDAPPVAPGGPFPLIVYSHGSSGQRFISAYLTEALAARGYVVVAVDHTGDTAVDQFTDTTLPRREIVPPAADRRPGPDRGADRRVGRPHEPVRGRGRPRRVWVSSDTRPGAPGC